jgi:hypothetical protein
LGKDKKYSTAWERTKHNQHLHLHQGLHKEP